LVKEGALAEGFELITKVSPKLAVVDFIKIQKNMKALKSKYNPESFKHYEISDYVLPEGMKDFNGKERTLYLRGATNTNKTEFGKAYYAAIFGAENVLRVNNLEGLREVCESTKAIILDDISFDEMSVEAKLGLTGVTQDHIQRVMYMAVLIRAGIARAIISNRSFADAFDLRGMPIAQRKALERRVHEVDIGEKTLRRLEYKQTTEIKYTYENNTIGNKTETERISPQVLLPKECPEKSLNELGESKKENEMPIEKDDFKETEKKEIMKEKEEEKELKTEEKEDKKVKFEGFDGKMKEKGENKSTGKKEKIKERKEALKKKSEKVDEISQTEVKLKKEGKNRASKGEKGDKKEVKTEVKKKRVVEEAKGKRKEVKKKSSKIL
jgi:hypothetical protein